MEHNNAVLQIDEELLQKLSKDKADVVNLSNAQLSDVAVQVIAYAIEKSNKVYSINLSDNVFTDAVCTDLSRMLAVNNNLVFVDFSHNKISDIGAEHLAPGFLKENKIKTLYLNGNLIGSFGLFKMSTAIARMKRLVSLDLSMNPIGDDGILCLLKAYKESYEESCLESLYIDGCNIYEDGALAAAALLSHIKSLSILHIEDNPITDNGAKALLAVSELPGKKLFITTGVGGLSPEQESAISKSKIDQHIIKEAKKYI